MNFLWDINEVKISRSIILNGKEYIITWVLNLDDSEAFGILEVNTSLVFIIGNSKEEAAEYLNKYGAERY